MGIATALGAALPAWMVTVCGARVEARSENVTSVVLARSGPALTVRVAADFAQCQVCGPSVSAS